MFLGVLGIAKRLHFMRNVYRSLMRYHKRLLKLRKIMMIYASKGTDFEWDWQW
jgi:hypothetical protein